MAEPAVKKRKVRKGTHSCWECRRRKIRCKFEDDEQICVNCLSRGSQCVSQEFTDEVVPSTDRGLARRLVRLEEMMGKLVDGKSSNTSETNPGSSEGTTSGSGNTEPSPSRSPRYVYRATRESELDLLDSSAVRNAHDITIVHSGSADANATYSNLPPTPSSGSSASPADGCRGTLPYPSLNSTGCFATSSNEASRCDRYRQISKELHALLPSPSLRAILAHESPGATTVLNSFHTHADQLANKPETPESLASPSYPTPESHPALLARRILQYAICLQQLPPTTDIRRLDLGDRMPCEVMSNWVGAASSLVTSSDDLVGCIEGLECLILLSMFQGEAGHLRKSWMTTRRALNMAQLMGIDRPNAPPLRSCTPPGDAAAAPKPCSNILWYRISCGDRYNSLILGLPVGSRNNSFADPSLDAFDDPLDRLGKSYAVISGRIADRNDLLSSGSAASAEAYGLTQSIDTDLESAAKAMVSTWWDTPNISAALRRPAPYLLAECSSIRLQCRHYTLLILLHLPYLLKDREGRRYEYNRSMCMRASRAVLERFLVFRKEYMVYVSGRNIDYAALTAAMTLLLGHLDARMPGGEEQREADRQLVEQTREKFRQLSSSKTDRLSYESAETITQMLPILSRDTTGGEQEKGVHLTVPFLGTVNINSTKPVGQSQVHKAASTNAQSSDPSLAESLGEDFNFDPPMSLSFDTNVSPSQGLGFGQGGAEPVCGSSWDGPSWLDFSAELEEWAFQGVDTTYWSVLNNSMS